jgi:hypothetical protein
MNLAGRRSIYFSVVVWGDVLAVVWLVFFFVAITKVVVVGLPLATVDVVFIIICLNS